MTLDSLYAQARDRVRVNPSDIPARSALWQVMAAHCDWDRARKQLDAMVALDSSWAMEANTCHGLIAAELQRERVFAGAELPVCLGEAPGWLAGLTQALKQLAELESPRGDFDSIRALAASAMAEAQQAAMAMAGSVNDQGFDWLCDGDGRVGPCLELVVNGRYFWLPWERVLALSTRRPTEIRDHIWLHALLEVEGADAFEAFLPARYPKPVGDEEQLGRSTTWERLSGDVFTGRGQRTLVTNTGEFGLLDVRELKFDPREAIQEGH